VFAGEYKRTVVIPGFIFGKLLNFVFLDGAFSMMKTKINQQNAQNNSGLIYY